MKFTYSSWSNEFKNKLNYRLGKCVFYKKFTLPESIKINEFETNFDNDNWKSIIIDWLKLHSKKNNMKKLFKIKSEASSYYVAIQ